jgi:hypothetical protein
VLVGARGRHSCSPRNFSFAEPQIKHHSASRKHIHLHIKIEPAVRRFAAMLAAFAANKFPPSEGERFKISPMCAKKSQHVQQPDSKTWAAN